MRVAHSLCRQGHLLLLCWVSVWQGSDAKPWLRCCTCLESVLLEAEVILQRISVQGPEEMRLCTHASTLAEAAVSKCSGSQPTVSPFCFQFLTTVTSYFQWQCFPTHRTTDVRLTWGALSSYISLGFSPLWKVKTSSFKCQLDHHKSSFTFFFLPCVRDCASMCPIGFRQFLYLLRWSLQELLGHR